MALTHIDAASVKVIGLDIAGPFPAPPVCPQGFFLEAGVAVLDGPAALGENRIASIRDPACAPSPTTFPFGVYVPDRAPGSPAVDVSLYRNVIEDTSAGIGVGGNAWADVQENSITGVSDDPLGLAVPGVEVRGPVKSRDTRPGGRPAIIHGNDIARFFSGIVLQRALDRHGPVVSGNRVSDSDRGIEVYAPRARVLANRITGAGDYGLVAGFADHAYIARNRVLGSAGYGFFVDQAQGVHLDHNVAADSGRLDCYDKTTGSGTAGTAKLWTADVGRFDDPNVCLSPRP
jgi:hypothetical protein